MRWLIASTWADRSRPRWPARCQWAIAQGPEPRLGVVACQELGLLLADLRKLFFEGAGDPLVVGLAVAPQQGLIRHVLNQRVFEVVDRIGVGIAPIQELGVHQPIEIAAQAVRAEGSDRRDEVVGEFAPQGGAELGDGFCRPQAIEPRHERVLQGGGDRKLARRGTAPLARELGRRAGLQHPLGEFLEEDRNPVGALDDPGRNGSGEEPVADHAAN